MSQARTPGGAGPGRAAVNGSVNGSLSGSVSGSPDGVAAQALPADPAALERLIDERRRRLAATVDELALRARPGEIARRGASGAQARLRAAVYTEGGRLRVERVGAVAAAVATLVALIVWRRRSR